MKKIITLVLLISGMMLSFAQDDCQNGRYLQPVFTDFTLDSEVEYGENANPSLIDPNARQTLYMNIYQPTGDTLSERPLMILAFGGAFVFGSKTSPDIVYLCEEFAKLGYVTAAIDYRLTTSLITQGNQKTATMAVLKASHDMRAAIRFFYKDAGTTNTYKIDTSRIFIGGVSAGALAAVHTAYLDQLSEIPAVIASDTAGLGGIAGLSGNPGYSSEVAGVINLCGAIDTVSFIEPNDPVLVSLHGTADGTVPYDRDTVTLFNLNLVVSGSAAIHAHLDTANLNIDHAFYSWEGAGHTPFVGISGVQPEYIDTTFRFVRDFLYDQQCGAMVSVDPSKERITIQAFPNPTEGDFYLKLSDQLPYRMQVHLYDAMGHNVPIQSTQIGDVIRIKNQYWTPGLYIWKVFDETGQNMGTGKLIHK